jgi:hypothetical protein
MDGPYSPGFGMTATAVIVPLSRELAIRGTFEPAVPSIDVDLAEVAEINGITAKYAHRQFFAADDEFVFLAGKDMRIIFGKDLTKAWSTKQ